MKILIVSDTHRKCGVLQLVLKRVGSIDMMIHLGDIEGDEDYIRTMAGCEVAMVSGNNDYFSRLNSEEELTIGKYKVLITHGHYYRVSLGTKNIMEIAKSRGFDIVMFGHTHRPMIEYGDGIIALNPGSISYPRQEPRVPSYMLMEIDRFGEAHFTICYVNQF